MMDEHDVDRMFTATKVNKEEKKVHQVGMKAASDKEQDVFRNEFVELLVRMASFKYRELEKTTNSFIDAFEMMHS